MNESRPDILKTTEQLRVDSIVYLLPYEVALMERRFAQLDTEHAEMGALLAEAMDQSSETYHDNAPAEAALNEASIIVWKNDQLLSTKKNFSVIDYPAEDDDKVRVGTRVRVAVNGGEPFLLDIVGAHLFGRDTHFDESGEEVEVSTYLSPLAAGLLDRAVEDTLVVDLHEREVSVRIVAVDQVAQRPR